MKKVLIVLMMMCLGLAGTAQAGDGEVLFEYWDGIGGTGVGDLTGNANFPGNPTGSTMLTLFEVPIDRGDDFGGRISGFLMVTGSFDYTFWISSDDSSELWLSSTGDPADATMIASVNGWTGSREWGKYGSQKSAPVKLYGNRKYYIEALYKEGGGGDNCAAAWESSDLLLDVIQGANLTTIAPGIHIATNPTPADGTTEISPDEDMVLSWEAPTNPLPGAITRYDVYASDVDTHVGDPNDSAGAFLGSVAAGDPLTLTVPAALLVKNTTYYWRVDTIVDAGAPATDPNNGLGAVWSGTTTWTLPIITAQPAGASAWPGDTATFTVEATSPLALSYQWYNSGGAIAGGTSNVLTISDAQESNVDDYYCVVSNDDGSATSASAALVMKHMLGWWKLDEAVDGIVADSSTGTENIPGTVMQGTSVHPDPNSLFGEAGMIDGAFNGNGSNTWIDVGKFAADLNLDGNKPKSVSAWVFTRSFNNGGIWDLGRRSTGQNFSLRTLTSDDRWRIQYWGGDWDFTTSGSGNGKNVGSYEAPTLNTWAHMVLTHGAEGTKIYLNGRLIVDWGGKVLNTGDQMTFRIGQYGPNNEKFNGLIDDLRLYDFALDATEVAILYTDVVLDAQICVGGNPASDLNGDCIVGIDDLVLFMLEYLNCNLVPDCKP